MRTTILTAFFMSAASLWPTIAAADVHDLEVITELSLGDRSTTGTDDELSGFGYDDRAGLFGALELRLNFDEGRYVQHGPMLAVGHHAGGLLGLVDGYAFRTTTVDLGWSGRALLPCISDREKRFYLTGVIGVTGLHADAGMGNGGRPNDDRYLARLAASETHDHVALGWRLAFSLDVHIGHFVVGPTLGIRQTFGVGTPLSRGVLVTGGLRLGARIGE